MVGGARVGGPLVVGYGADENYLGSDALALAPLTQKIAYLEEGDWAVITRGSVTIFDSENQPVERPVTQSGVSGAMIDKGHNGHFMQKEIFERPVVVDETLQSYLRPLENQVALPDLAFDLENSRHGTLEAT